YRRSVRAAGSSVILLPVEDADRGPEQLGGVGVVMAAAFQPSQVQQRRDATAVLHERRPVCVVGLAVAPVTLERDPRSKMAIALRCGEAFWSLQAFDLAQTEIRPAGSD